MKRAITLILAMAMALALSACGGEESSAVVSQEAASSAASSEASEEVSVSEPEEAEDASSEAEDASYSEDELLGIDESELDFDAMDAVLNGETEVAVYGGILGGQMAIIGDCELIDDYDGAPALKVYFDYANASGEPLYFYSAFATLAFQNGVALDDVGLNDESEECQNLTREIKDEAELTCAMIYQLNDMQSPVEVVICSPTADQEQLATKTFEIAK